MKKTRPSIRDIFSQAGLPAGRYWGSASSYRANHPGAQFRKNAWVFTSDGNRVWGGDLDLATSDRQALMSVSRKLNRKLYVLREQATHRPLTLRELREYAEVTIWRNQVRVFNPDARGFQQLLPLIAGLQFPIPMRTAKAER